MNAIERKALRWLFGPNTGLSSESMCCFFLTGETPCRGAYAPGDPSDFRRCMGLLEAVPEWRKRVPELAALGGEWVGISKDWDRVEALYRKEAPTGRCPETYALMVKLQLRKPAVPRRSEER